MVRVLTVNDQVSEYVDEKRLLHSLEVAKLSYEIAVANDLANPDNKIDRNVGYMIVAFGFFTIGSAVLVYFDVGAFLQISSSTSGSILNSKQVFLTSVQAEFE